jgi:dienelactone hydrolase
VSSTPESVPRAQAPAAAVAVPRLSLRRLGGLAAIAVVAGATVALLPWINAERQAVIVVSQTSSQPIVSWVVGLLTASPKTEETTIGGAPATIVKPGRGSSWHAVLLLPGTADRGRANPEVLRLAKALARAGFLVAVPDLPGTADGEIVPDTVQAAVNAGVDLAHRSDVKGGEIALAGSWAGASLALLAAEDPLLAPRVSVVAAVAPWSAEPNALRLATTGYVLDGGQVKSYPASPRLSLVAARSLVAALGPGTERTQLLQLLQGVAPNDPDPLKVVRGLSTATKTPEAAAVVRLLGNTQPTAFDGLYADLPDSLHAQIERLSPLVGASQLQGKVELAVAGDDSYAPASESDALGRASSNVHMTVTDAVKNGLPSPSIGSALSTNSWLLGALRAAS